MVLSKHKTNGQFACRNLDNMVGDNKKIGLIAGAGDLPHTVLVGAKQQGYDVFIAALKGFAKPRDKNIAIQEFGLGEIGGLIKAFKTHACTHIVMAGHIGRPDFKTLKPDLGGLALLPKAILAASKGDDSLLRFITDVLEKEGFVVLAPQDFCASSLMPAGVLGRVKPKPSHTSDIEKAWDIAAFIGKRDIGQGAIVCNGLVLAVEAQEGTDEMLNRVASLPENIRGTRKDKSGVLAKRLKSGQEQRIDLPTIGVVTVKRVAKAGLAGIILESGKAFVLDMESVTKVADSLGVFVLGIENST